VLSTIAFDKPVRRVAWMPGRRARMERASLTNALSVNLG